MSSPLSQPHVEATVGKRSVAVDFMRIVAIMAVVCVHALPVPLLAGQEASVIISAVIGSLSKIGVPLFLIITGYLMLDRDYTGSWLIRFLKHNYLPLFVSYETWVIIATAMKLIANPSTKTVTDGLRAMLCLGEPFMIHFWYMQMILGIYLFMSIIASFIQTCGRCAVRYIRMLIVIGVVLVFALPTAQMVYCWFGGSTDYEVTLGGFAGRGALGVFYMLLGYALRKDLFAIGGRIARVVFAILSLALLWITSVFELSTTGELFQANTGFLPIALTAFAFANWMIHAPSWNQCPTWLASFLRYLAGCAFGIYMVHPLIIEIAAKLIPQSVHLMRIAFLNPISIFMISLCCCALLSQLKPFRKWLLLQK